MNDANPTDWLYVPSHGQIGQVIESQELWGKRSCRVWLPGKNTIVRIPTDQLASLAESGVASPQGVTYVAAAARVADALNQNVLLAPIESSVIPLPHQIQALSRAIEGDRVRYLLADEVGLGKTIEAGLIIRELKLRGLAKRILVVAPKGLATQWVAEMNTHFNEEFQLLVPGEFTAYRRVIPDGNIWQNYPQVICPMDSVKPMDTRRGWSSERIVEYNQERFGDLISAGWDLIIVDEAHRLGGSTDQVARFRLGQGLADAAPYLLLLSATPHQGKTDAFHRLLTLLDDQEFPDTDSVTRDRVQPYVIRTEKRNAITAEGNPLFLPRETKLEAVSWGDNHQDQRLLYEAITHYVREGYNQAMKEKRSYIGFLMILMQRLVVSSTAAIRRTLERRLEVLAVPQEQLSLFPSYTDDEWMDLDGQEQMETLLTTKLKALKNERAEVELLLDAATKCAQRGTDAKADALLQQLYDLQAEEGDAELKFLIFTEFVPTQAMLQTFLSERGFSATILNGSMGMDERKAVQQEFAGKTRILISTDAGGEGLNLQFCHVVVNYDIPWNPMRLEQRIGRVDRIGQDKVVRAINFVFEDSIEHRVREVLEQKLAIIYEEFGIDKTGDVLDSSLAGKLFDDLYVDAIMRSDKIEESVDKVVGQLKQIARDAKQNSILTQTPGATDSSQTERIVSHPLPHWIEYMVLNYLRSHGGRAEKKRLSWELEWPDGYIIRKAVFSGQEAMSIPGTFHITTEHPRIQALALKMSRFVPGQPIPVIQLPDTSSDIEGIWSIWKVCSSSHFTGRARYMPVFQSADGKSFPQTALHLWDVLLSAPPQELSILGETEARPIALSMVELAETQCRPLYEELLADHKERMRKEKEKGLYAFKKRKAVIDAIGLPQVRNYRLRQLHDEMNAWEKTIEERDHVHPEMLPLIMVKVVGGAP